MLKEKHEQFTPKDVNPSSLVLFNEVLAVSICKNKDLKSKLYQKVCFRAETPSEKKLFVNSLCGLTIRLWWQPSEAFCFY